MKVCEKCGAQLEDSASFCTGCGQKFGASVDPVAPVGGQAQPQSPFAPKQNAKGGLNKVALIGICAGAAVLVVLLISLIVGLFTGYKKPIKAYYKAQEESREIVKGYTLPIIYEKTECKISYDITDKAKIDKSDLDDLADIFEDSYDEEYKFSSGYALEVDVEYEFEDEDIDSYDETEYFIVVKKGLKWYVYAQVSGSDVDDIVEDYIDRYK